MKLKNWFEPHETASISESKPENFGFKIVGNREAKTDLSLTKRPRFQNQNQKTLVLEAVISRVEATLPQGFSSPLADSVFNGMRQTKMKTKLREHA